MLVYERVGGCVQESTVDKTQHGGISTAVGGELLRFQLRRRNEEKWRRGKRERPGEGIFPHLKRSDAEEERERRIKSVWE